MDYSKYFTTKGKLKKGHPGDLSPGRPRNVEEWTPIKRKGWKMYLAWIRQFSENKGVNTLPATAKTLLRTARGIYERLMMLEADPTSTDMRLRHITSLASNLTKLLKEVERIVKEDRKKFEYVVEDSDGDTQEG
jgi:hypothetical protein